MSESLPACRECGGHLQRIPSMPGHVVCGSGHLFTEQQLRPAAGHESAGPAVQVRRVSDR